MLFDYKLDIIAPQNCNGSEFHTIMGNDGSIDGGFESVQKDYPWEMLKLGMSSLMEMDLLRIKFVIT